MIAALLAAAGKALTTVALAMLSSSVATALPYTFKALVVPMSVCNYVPSTSSAALDATLFGTHSYSVEQIFTGCSYGHAVFSRDHVTVLQYAVPAACGVATDPDLACDYQQWAQVADHWLATNTQTFGQAQYSHMIYVLPRGIHTCGSWGGMGFVGCKGRGPCRVWIRGEVDDQPMTYVHELLHNLGLNHANTPQLEYGDASDAMGLCCSVRCPNAANLDHLGWAAAIAELNVTTMLHHKWHLLSLAVTTSASAPYLKITSPCETVYVQFRMKHAFDNGVPASGVYVYNVAAAAAAVAGFPSSTQYGWLQAAKQVFRAGSGFQVKLAQDLQPYDTLVHVLVCVGMCS